MNTIDINLIKTYLINLQNQICHEFETTDGKATFQHDSWQRLDGGGGDTRVITNGDVFEKGGVNFSHVHGEKLPISATTQRPELADCEFDALGVSIVMHADNPFVPTSHANIRFFQAKNPSGETIWWFGGGYDLTPYYGFKEDCKYWHQTAKNACDPFGKEVYASYKKWCDDYFYLKHRQEARGIGGLFFDDLNQWNFQTCFAFMQAIGNSYLKAYLPIVEKRKATPFTETHKIFQRIRRGRYVEFNLVYDRGTLFGLQSGGRTESILMSLPPEVIWQYDYAPEPDSDEAKLLTDFLPARDWLSA